jgi:hypothetical protein
MVEATRTTNLNDDNEDFKEPEKESLKVAPGEMEVKLTSLDVKLKASLEDRDKY